ncbi:hypothetical protein PFISCL1PPCAC_3471, partial [Pristionchus fissidentatus]
PPPSYPTFLAMGNTRSRSVSEQDAPRSKDGSEFRQRSHKTFDHSSFPDAVTLIVGNESFVISSSHISLHSPFFHDFSKEASPNWMWTLERLVNYST